MAPAKNRKLNKAACKNVFIRLFPVMLLFIVTYAIYTPSALFLGNIEEYSIYYIEIIPILLCVSLISALIIYVFAICLSHENTLHIYIAFLFGISLGLYFQGIFLNRNLPVLDGTEINWQAYQIENLHSAVFWVLCIIICLSLMHVRKEKTEKVMKYISYFISAVQTVSLVVLIATSGNIPSGYSKYDQFTIGSENNVIMFVVDTLQAAALEEYIASDAYQDGILDDFTFFDNAVSGAAPTYIALPLLLTGVEYDPTQSLESYAKEAWEETALYNDLHHSGRPWTT